MEHCKDKTKRVRDDSPDSKADSPDSKIHRVDSGGGPKSSESQLSRVDSGESCLNSEIQDDLFNILGDNDNVPERDSAMQGLDSVIKSFEVEILAPAPGPNPEPDTGELQPNLGYLFEASDDELGLPPTVMAPVNEEPGRVGPEGVDLTGFVGFEDDIPNYDTFGFGSRLGAECDSDEGGAGGFVLVDGLFDYADTADILWRSESLQAT